MIKKQDILIIKNLHASIDGKKILNGFTLTIKSGEIHVIMGPNASGKTTLLNVLMGHPKYKVEKGEVTFNNKNILKLDTSERAKLGLFLSFQHPVEVPGVTFGNFLRTAKNSILKSGKMASIGPMEFVNLVKDKLERLNLDHKFLGRSLNEGFSGGEKKRAEIMQMDVLEPKIVFLDEIDSGLDIDALRIVSKSIKEIFNKNKPGILLVTHYKRILEYVTPDFVHVMHEGKIVKSGGSKLAHELEEKGYGEWN